MSPPPKKPSWRTWHLIFLFSLGSIVEWAGESLKSWAGGKLKESWKSDK